MRSCGLPLVAASVLFGGCTMLHSSNNPMDGGIAYHLPRTVITAKVDLWRRPLPGKKADSTNEADFEYLAGLDMAVEGGQKATRGDVIPDLSERFTLAYSSNPFFNDRYCVVADTNGLLKSIEYATEDKTPQIVLALAELGQKLAAGGFVSDRPADAPDKPVTSAIVTFNPFDSRDRAAAARVVNTTFNNKAIVSFEFPDLVGQKRGVDNKCYGSGGVCFRTVVNTPIRLKDLRTETVTSIGMVEVVNPYYVGHMDLDRAFMVEKVHRLGFQNGALTQVIMRKPSEALQTVKLPLAVVDAILAVPANFISKAGGDSAQIKRALEEQRTTIDKIQEQLNTGLAATGTFNTAPYTETCSGGPLR